MRFKHERHWETKQEKEEVAAELRTDNVEL